MADSVDGQLRQTLRAARSRCLRGIKAIVTKKSSSEGERYALALANSMPDEGEALDKEFARCVQGLLEPDKPSFLLFRADVSENIDGCRWLLLAWLPDVVPEVERLRYVRSRNLLADQLPQPFFFRELLLREAKQLLWSSAAAALRSAASPNLEETVAPRFQPRQEAAEGPVRLSQAAQSLLQRMARRDETCLRLVFSGRFSLKQMKTLPSIAEQLSAASQTGPQLEAKAVDCRSPSQLAKADLPSTSCYFALFSREDLVFVHWCPDRMSRDHFTRMRDDSRYAVLKPAVMKLVMDAFDPQVRLLQVDAREPQELVDHANRADERMVADVLGSKVLVPQGGTATSGDCKFPDKGAKADWPLDWPKEVTIPVAMPANLCFFLRPVPYWRGGSKEHTINPNAQNVQNLRSKLARKSLRDQL